MSNKEQLNELIKDTFIEYLGIELVHVDEESCVVTMRVQAQNMMAPNGFVHGGVMSSLADTACGLGSIYHLKDGETFTTIEFKINFIATPTKTRIVCEAKLLHKGRTTQVWDAKIIEDESKRILAHFRCTNLLMINSFDNI